MSRPVPADPASLAAAAHTFRRCALALTADAEQATQAWRACADAVRLPRDVARRAEGVTRAASEMGALLDALAGTLQERAVALSALAREAREIEGRVSAAGGELRDGRVQPRFGITGAADAARERSRAGDLAALQDRLDRVRAAAAGQRDLLAGPAAAATDRLAALAEALRA